MVEAVLPRARTPVDDKAPTWAETEMARLKKPDIFPVLDRPKPSPVLPAPYSKQDLLDAAKAATADRGLNYGGPEANFDRIAARWRVHLKNRFGLDVAIDGVSVALMMADMKIARLEHAPKHLDSWVDGAGYIACGAEIAMAVQS